jgi:hypothetical protein
MTRGADHFDVGILSAQRLPHVVVDREQDRLASREEQVCEPQQPRHAHVLVHQARIGNANGTLVSNKPTQPVGRLTTQWPDI